MLFQRRQLRCVLDVYLTRTIYKKSYSLILKPFSQNASRKFLRCASHSIL